nr:tyrosine-type recombinase/integrase [Cytobacillus dafuensis]
MLKKTTSINKRLTPHTLRHTHTSLLTEAGVELLEIMDRLGHTEDETTTQVYLHITKDRKKSFPKVCSTNEKPLIFIRKGSGTFSAPKMIFSPLDP